jgi:hypothetical protein
MTGAACSTSISPEAFTKAFCWIRWLADKESKAGPLVVVNGSLRVLIKSSILICKAASDHYRGSFPIVAQEGGGDMFTPQAGATKRDTLAGAMAHRGQLRGIQVFDAL